MAGLRFTDLQSRPMAFLDFTSLTLDEFQQLVPPFETRSYWIPGAYAPLVSEKRGCFRGVGLLCSRGG